MYNVMQMEALGGVGSDHLAMLGGGLQAAGRLKEEAFGLLECSKIQREKGEPAAGDKAGSDNADRPQLREEGPGSFERRVFERQTILLDCSDRLQRDAAVGSLNSRDLKRTIDRIRQAAGNEEAAWSDMQTLAFWVNSALHQQGSSYRVYVEATTHEGKRAEQTFWTVGMLARPDGKGSTPRDDRATWFIDWPVVSSFSYCVRNLPRQMHPAA